MGSTDKEKINNNKAEIIKAKADAEIKTWAIKFSLRTTLSLLTVLTGVLVWYVVSKPNGENALLGGINSFVKVMGVILGASF